MYVVQSIASMHSGQTGSNLRLIMIVNILSTNNEFTLLTHCKNKSCCVGKIRKSWIFFYTYVPKKYISTFSVGICGEVMNIERSL